mmetsp:Transcript_95318/g.269744  ORF Transcript_95318/g.269744 Transcript_95318/m.269744 type:complete len:267 (-) Transcript_95318:40-840(-)
MGPVDRRVYDLVRRIEDDRAEVSDHPDLRLAQPDLLGVEQRLEVLLQVGRGEVHAHGLDAGLRADDLGEPALLHHAAQPRDVPQREEPHVRPESPHRGDVHEPLGEDRTDHGPGHVDVRLHLLEDVVRGVDRAGPHHDVALRQQLRGVAADLGDRAPLRDGLPARQAGRKHHLRMLQPGLRRGGEDLRHHVRARGPGVRLEQGGANVRRVPGTDERDDHRLRPAGGLPHALPDDLLGQGLQPVVGDRGDHRCGRLPAPRQRSAAGR